METREEHYASMMQAITRYAPSADLDEEEVPNTEDDMGLGDI